MANCNVRMNAQVGRCFSLSVMCRRLMLPMQQFDKIRHMIAVALPGCHVESGVRIGNWGVELGRTVGSGVRIGNWGVELE